MLFKKDKFTELLVAILSVLLLSCSCLSYEARELSDRILAEYLRDSLYVPSQTFYEYESKPFEISVQIELRKYQSNLKSFSHIGFLKGVIQYDVKIQGDSVVLSPSGIVCDTLINPDAIYALGGQKMMEVPFVQVDQAFIPDPRWQRSQENFQIIGDGNVSWSQNCIEPLKQYMQSYLNSTHFYVLHKNRRDGILFYTSYHRDEVLMFSRKISQHVNGWSGNYLRYKVSFLL